MFVMLAARQRRDGEQGLRIIIGLSALVVILALHGCAAPGGGSTAHGADYTPREGLTAQQRFKNTIDLLEAGDPIAARSELVLYLDTQPGSKVGQDLLKQIDLPAFEYFPQEYRVVQLDSGQSLSNLSHHYLGSLYRFHALAKYNGIAKPRSLKAGQMVRIPLTAEAREVFAAENAAVGKDAQEGIVTTPKSQLPATDASQPKPAPTSGAGHEAVDVEQLHRGALKAYRAQDLDSAIALWDQVLAEDPSHENARLYRSQALELKKKLGSLD